MAKLTNFSGHPFSGLVPHAVVGVVTDNVDEDELGHGRVVCLADVLPVHPARRVHGRRVLQQAEAVRLQREPVRHRPRVPDPHSLQTQGSIITHDPPDPGVDHHT